jgi:hypothetical protein
MRPGAGRTDMETVLMTVLVVSVLAALGAIALSSGDPDGFSSA